MAIRTVPDSVERVPGPVPQAAAVEARLEALRARFPGVVLRRYLDRGPTVADDVFLAEGAVLVGDVRLAQGSSVWFGCVLRGDLTHIEVGPRSNLQDGTVVHLGDRDPTVVGADVVVGHRALLHGCVIEDACLVGMGAIVLDGAVVGTGSIVGAGAVVTAGTRIPPHSLVLGTPGRVVKTLDPDLGDFHREVAAKYTRLAHNHRVG
ncbi:MAG: gamma carbonic anhydrase family protein [Alphaproteobacteria bacterium]|nr:gamma carbonic anhydrase family protein [Alphaproteobacteria bacterium]